MTSDAGTDKLFAYGLRFKNGKLSSKLFIFKSDAEWYDHKLRQGAVGRSPAEIVKFLINQIDP